MLAYGWQTNLNHATPNSGWMMVPNGSIVLKLVWIDRPLYAGSRSEINSFKVSIIHDYRGLLSQVF